jgi:hypothetical protein
MPGKTKFFLLLSAILLTMCKNYENEPITYENGLSCRNYVEYRFFQGDGNESRLYSTQEGADCVYVCRDESEHQIAISGTASELYGASVDELEAQVCGFVVVPTATPRPTSTPTATPTRRVRPTRTSSPTEAPSATVVVVADPLLDGTVPMCDLGGKLINFRILTPSPDLTESTLEVLIGDQRTQCNVNSVNPSLLTCSLPNDISFPAHVVVRLDGEVVNDFIYNGVGCGLLTTPTLE